VGRKLSKPRPAQGARLVALRKAAGLTQTELAHSVGVPQANIAFWERSDKPPRSDVLPKLAEVLGARIEDILGPAGSGGSVTRTRRRSGPVGKLEKAFEEAASLPRRQQQKVVEIVSAIVNEFRRKAS